MGKEKKKEIALDMGKSMNLWKAVGKDGLSSPAHSSSNSVWAAISYIIYLIRINLSYHSSPDPVSY